LKIIFLDVDGVLNSYRNVIAFGGFPFPGRSGKDNPHAEENLDPIAIGMIRKLCKEFDAKIVLHSTWRTHVNPREFGEKYGLPIIDVTPTVSKSQSIKLWLREKGQEVINYIIIDDDDMDDKHRQVFTDIYEGFIYKDYIRAQKKLAQAEGLGQVPGL
jgi:hypothetical protein